MIDVDAWQASNLNETVAVDIDGWQATIQNNYRQAVETGNVVFSGFFLDHAEPFLHRQHSEQPGILQ